METALIVLGTGLASSIFTLVGAYVFYRAYLERHLDAELDRALVEVKLRLRDGFTEAARELLPEVKKEVSEGFKDALSSAMGGELMDRTAQVAAKTGASFMETGLNLLLGRPPEKKG